MTPAAIAEAAALWRLAGVEPTPAETSRAIRFLAELRSVGHLPLWRDGAVRCERYPCAHATDVRILGDGVSPLTTLLHAVFQCPQRGMRAAEGSSPEAAPEEETPPPAVVRFSKAHGGVERVSVLDGTTGQPPPEREPAPMQPPRNLSQNLSEQRSRPNEAAQQPEPYALEMGTWRLNQRPGDPPVATQRDPGPSTAFDQLQRGAAEAARCLGHRLGAWYIRADASVAAATSCETCAAGLHVALMPEGGRPNIEGRAATTLCSGGAA